MGKDSHIEWTDHTFNPWEGCTKVSPGCAHCYAEARNARFGGGTSPNWGKGAPRRRTSVHNWNEPRRWNRDPENNPYWASRRPRVFCASLADWLDDEVPLEWFMDLLMLIKECQNLDFQLLTKRPENWRSRLASASELASKAGNWQLSVWIANWVNGTIAPANVWIGTSVEDQTRADERIPELLKIPASVRFLSMEPLLGAVDLVKWLHPDGRCGECLQLIRSTKDSVSCDCCCEGPEPTLDRTDLLDWVIVGGESGAHARPMHPDWVTSLRDQCVGAGVPFFFKQWGEWLPDCQRRFTSSGDITWGLIHEAGRYRAVLNKGNRYAESDPGWRDGEQGTTRFGKIVAGRQLDGREWNELPAAR